MGVGRSSWEGPSRELGSLLWGFLLIGMPLRILSNRFRKIGRRVGMLPVMIIIFTSRLLRHVVSDAALKYEMQAGNTHALQIRKSTVIPMVLLAIPVLPLKLGVIHVKSEWIVNVGR